MSVRRGAKNLAGGHFCRPRQERVVAPVLPRGDAVDLLGVTTGAPALDGPSAGWIGLLADRADAAPCARRR
eukprot:3717647-Pyramimonas_sp.AAC.1